MRHDPEPLARCRPSSDFHPGEILALCRTLVAMATTKDAESDFDLNARKA